MKAILIDSVNARQGQKGKIKSPALSKFRLFPLDQVVVLGSWNGAGLYRKNSRFKTPVTFRLAEASHAVLNEVRTLERMIELEELEDAALLIETACMSSLEFGSLKRAIAQNPHVPLVGIRKKAGAQGSNGVLLAEGNRVLRFLSIRQNETSEWVSAGVFYFPRHFLSDGVLSYLKGAPENASLHGFLNWSVRNFKVYAHVFGA